MRRDNSATHSGAVKSGAEKPRDRRNFLKAGAGAAVGTATLGFPMVSRAQTVTLKMQGAWGAKNIFTEMAQEYVKRVNEMSGGRLKIDYLAAGGVVKAFELQNTVHNGVLDGGHQVTAYWYGKHKAAALFGAGPVFGANAAQILAWIHKGGGKELYQELVNDILKLNLVGFFCMPMPTQPLGWFQKAVENADDLNGLKYNTAGLAADIMQGMGLEVNELPGGEVVPALERGAIEAFEYNNPTSDSRFGAQDVSKIYMMGSHHQAAEFFEIIFNKTKFESLPKEFQAILEYAAEAANTANYATAMDNYSRDLQKLIDAGVQVFRTPQSVMEAQLGSWDEVLDNLMQDSFFKKVVESQRDWARRVGFYSLLSSADYRLAYEHYFPGELAKAGL